MHTIYIYVIIAKLAAKLEMLPVNVLLGTNVPELTQLLEGTATKG